MADILISMEMPQRCKACRFCGFGGRRSELNICMFTGESQPKLSQERMSKCPIVPLPEGHGDLMDKAAFETDIKNRYCTGCDNYKGLKCKACWVDDMLGEVEDAPTIVPAEGGTDDGV